MMDGDIEFNKAYIEYLKHIGTLSAGSIVLIPALLEKTFTSPHWKWLLGFAVGSFAVCIITSVIAFFVTVEWRFPGGPSPTTSSLQLATRSLNPTIVMSLVSFAIGMTALGAFVIRNVL